MTLYFGAQYTIHTPHPPSERICEIEVSANGWYASTFHEGDQLELLIQDPFGKKETEKRVALLNNEILPALGKKLQLLIEHFDTSTKTEAQAQSNSILEQLKTEVLKAVKQKTLLFNNQ